MEELSLEFVRVVEGAAMAALRRCLSDAPERRLGARMNWHASPTGCKSVESTEPVDHYV